MRQEALNPYMGGDLKESFDFGLSVDEKILSQLHVGLFQAISVSSFCRCQ